jgi:hypothetical protein
VNKKDVAINLLPEKTSLKNFVLEVAHLKSLKLSLNVPIVKKLLSENFQLCEILNQDYIFVVKNAKILHKVLKAT